MKVVSFNGQLGQELSRDEVVDARLVAHDCLYIAKANSWTSAIIDNRRGDPATMGVYPPGLRGSTSDGSVTLTGPELLPTDFVPVAELPGTPSSSFALMATSEER